MRPVQMLATFLLVALGACSSTDWTWIEPTPIPAPSNGEPENAELAAAASTINGLELDARARADFERLYRQELPAGAYWYDARSGAIGLMGHGIGGFLLAGHDFGRIPENCSNGDSGVIINGRNLPWNECAYLSRVLGTQALPGRYWIDAQGNYGYEGFDFALGNLAAGARSGGGDGDNYWSSRYGSGNSNADNSAGYVYIPGTGSVSYGF